MTADIARILVGGYAAFWALYLLLLPLVAALTKARKRAPVKLEPEGWPKIAVIVPGRNAEQVIARCVHSLRACHYPREKLDIYVVADHCADRTAESAMEAGAAVLIRDDGPQGKTYALAWALYELSNRGCTPDLYVIVDATAVVDGNFLSAMAEAWRQGEDIISSRPALSPENRSWYARCLGLMLVHRNLQCRAREKLGLSALLEGRGMAYSRGYVERFGWRLALPRVQGSHPTQDWRHAVRAVEQGYRVAFAESARLTTPLRGSFAEATQQGARWERGRLINAGTYAVRLLLLGLWERDPVKLFAALDAIQPPVAILGGLSVGIAVTGFLGPAVRLLRAGGFIPLSLVCLYGLCVALRGRRDGIEARIIIWGPLYLAWRCASFVLAWAFVDRIGLGWRSTDAAGRLNRRAPSPASGESTSKPPA